MDNKTTQNKLENGRASAAYTAAKNGVGRKGDEYKNFAKKLPMLIKSNGLAGALAFTKKQRKELYEDVKKWLVDEKKMIELEDRQTLVDYLVNIETPEYRTITVEVMAFLSWVRRFADGIEKNAKNEKS